MDYTIFLWSIPFFGISIFHLYGCLIDNNKMADISKALLMPMLLFGLWGFIGISQGKTVLEQNTVLLSLGIIFGGMGDVYLLKKTHTPSFMRGLAAFFIGHIFYLIVICSVYTFLPLPPVFVIIAIVIYLLLVIAAWFINKCQKGAIGIAIVLYALLLASLNAIALFLFVGLALQQGLSSVPSNIVFLFMGSILFLVSDTVLSRTIFVKTFPFHRFIVMLTYLAAQFFIVFGIAII